jgi:hypothetical protein
MLPLLAVLLLRYFVDMITGAAVSGTGTGQKQNRLRNHLPEESAVLTVDIFLRECRLLQLFYGLLPSWHWRYWQMICSLLPATM